MTSNNLGAPPRVFRGPWKSREEGLYSSKVGAPLIAPNVERGSINRAEAVSTPAQREAGVNNQLDRTLFARAYDALPTNVWSPYDVMQLLPATSQLARMPIVRQAPKTQLPGMNTWKHEVLRFQREFSDLLEKDCAPQYDERGFTANGFDVPGSFMKCIGGMPQLPLSAAPRSNEGERALIGLKPLTARQIELISWFYSRICSVAVITPRVIPKGSQTGPGRETRDMDYRMAVALGMLDPARLERFFDLTLRGAFATLLDEFECVFMNTVAARIQVDAPRKEARRAFLIDECIRQLRPERHPVRTGVAERFPEFADFAGERLRLYYVGQWVVSCVMSLFANATLNALYTIYGETFNVDYDATNAWAQGGYIEVSDASNYDQQFSQDYFLAVAKGIEMSPWHHGFAVTYLASLMCGYAARPMDLKGRVNLLTDPSRFLEAWVASGNRSGVATTSLDAKTGMVLCVMEQLERLGLGDLKSTSTRYANWEQMDPSLKWMDDPRLAHFRPTLMDELLKHKRPEYSCKNNGDDHTHRTDLEWIAAGGYNYAKLVFTMQEQKPGQAMFVYKPEVGAAYSGQLYVPLDAHKKGRYKLQSKPLTPFRTTYLPERSIDMRPFWALGLNQKLANKTENDAMAQAWDIHDFAYRKHLEPIYGTLGAIVAKGMESMPIINGALTSKDIAVLENPRKLHYEFEPHEIDAQVLELVGKTIPVGLIVPAITKVFTGVIHIPERVAA